MTQKLLQIGSSVGITIPKQYLMKQGLKVGDEVEISIKPARKISDEDEKIAKLTLKFINRCRKDLEALARK